MLQTHTVELRTLDLLKAIQAHEVFDSFCLVGGTNLALRFGHKLSIDLDFFTSQVFDSESIYRELLNKNFTSLEVINQTEHSLLCLINDIRTDFILHEYSYLDPVEVIDGVKLASIADVAAMKVNAVTKRGAKKDFFDLAELLNRFRLQTILDFYSQKYTNHDLSFVLRSLVYFEDADHQPDPIILNSMEWEAVKTLIKEEVKEYFNK